MSGFDLGGLQGFGAELPRVRLQGEAPAPPAAVDGAGQQRFAGFLEDAVSRVDSLQDEVKDKYIGLVTGEQVELHDLMAAMGRSEVAFNLLLEVRNRLVDAWDKLSRSVM